LAIVPKGNTMFRSREITIGIKGLVSTQFSISVRTKKGSDDDENTVSRAIDLTNGKHSPTQYAKNGETLYFKFFYTRDNEGDQGGLEIAVSTLRGSVSLLVTKDESVQHLSPSNAQWMKESFGSSSSLFIPKHNPCGEQIHNECNNEKAFAKGSWFIIGVKGDVSIDSVFTVTATLVNDPITLSTGVMQFRSVQQLSKGTFGALFSYKAASTYSEFLQVDTTDLPQLEGTNKYCNLIVYLYKCKSNFGQGKKNDCRQTEFFADPKSDSLEISKYTVSPYSTLQESMQDSSFEGTYYVYVLEEKEDNANACEPHMSFHIGFMSAFVPSIVQPSCFKNPEHNHLCLVAGDEDASRKQYGTSVGGFETARIKVVEDDLGVLFQICKGKLLLAVCEVKFEQDSSGPRSLCSYPEIPNDSPEAFHYTPKLNSGQRNQLFPSEINNIKTYHLGIRNIEETASTYRLQMISTKYDYDKLLKPLETVVQKQSETSVEVSVNPHLIDGSTITNADTQLEYDIYWWEYSPVLAYKFEDNIFDTECGLLVLEQENAGDVRVQKNVKVDDGKYVLEGLSLGKQYQINMVLHCKKPGDCGEGVPAHSVAYKPQYFSTANGPENKGWFTFVLIIIGAVTVVLLLPGFVYLKRIFMERRRLKQQLRYEMQDVRNMARSGGLEPLSTMEDDEAGIAMRVRQDETSTLLADGTTVEWQQLDTI